MRTVVDYTRQRNLLAGGGCVDTAADEDFTALIAEYSRDLLGLPDPGDDIADIEDIRLRYDPGQTTETVIAVDCPNGANGETGLTGHWNRFFLATHTEEFTRALSEPEFAGEIDTSGRIVYLDTGWGVESDELLAELAWEKPAVAGVTEEGSFTLYHRPQ